MPLQTAEVCFQDQAKTLIVPRVFLRHGVFAYL